MKVTIAVLVVIIAVLVLVIIMLATRNRRGEVRGEEYRRMRRECDQLAGAHAGLVDALDAIELLCDQHSDTESFLASQVRTAIRSHRKERNTTAP